jgi:hypothetical protein
MTFQRPQTIQIFLPDGNPTSIKIADLTNRMMTAVLFPRNKLIEVGLRDEVKKYGVYFLFGYNDEKAKPLCYIGETEDCFERIKTHNKNKDFWSHAIVITSKSNTFTKSHVKYLEYLCIKNANEIARYDTENLSTPAKPYITESMEADLQDNYDTVKILLATLGYPIFEELKKSSVKKKDALYCKGKDAKAEGDMVDDGFVVFKGSIANKEETNTAGTWVSANRNKLIESKILIEKNGVFIFTEDYLFGSPSTAAATVLGRRANGWTEWKNLDGKTIDKLYRTDSLEAKTKK